MGLDGMGVRKERVGDWHFGATLDLAISKTCSQY